MLLECNCNWHARWSGATVTHKHAGKEQILKTWVLQQACWSREAVTEQNCLFSDMCTIHVPHNQTCLMVNMSADLVGMMAALLVWCKLNRYAHWLVLLQDGYLLDRCHSIIMPMFCNSILHVCWRCASLSALSVGMVSHYQPCLLVWCLA